MDLTGYYEKIREAKAKITDEFAVVVSNQTSDGGKAGLCTEVPRAVAARMVVDGVARQASAAEQKAFRDTQAKAKKQADEIAAAAKVTFQVQAQTGTVQKG
jgi:hypothetical protein